MVDKSRREKVSPHKKKRSLLEFEQSQEEPKQYFEKSLSSISSLNMNSQLSEKKEPVLPPKKESKKLKTEEVKKSI